MPVGSDPSTKEGQPLSPPEIRHALWVAAIAWGVFGSAWMTMVGGTPYVTFVRQRLHVSIFMYTILGSLPYASAVAQLVGSWIVERTRSRRRLFLFCATAGRLTWLLVAALPWVVPATLPALRVGAFLGLMLLASVLGALSTPAWFSWFGDMVPENIRGRYLSQRAALATATQVVAGIIVPWFVDRDSSFATFTIIFAIASLLGTADVSLFWTVREPPMPPHEGEPWPRLRWWSVFVEPARVFRVPLRDRQFRGYLIYALSETFMFGIAGSFFTVMGLEFLKIGNLGTTIYASTIPLICTVVALPLWGGICDRFGHRPLLAFGTLGSVAYPVFWLLATPEHHVTALLGAALIGGSCGAAVTTADMSMMYAFTPREGRSAYMACIMLATSVGWAVAPLLSGKMADLLVGWQYHLWGLTFVNFHLIMLASLIARVLHVIFILPLLPEEHPRPTRDLIRHLARSPFAHLAAGYTRLANVSREAVAARRGRGEE